MAAVGQFDQNDTHVAGHGQEHFSKRLGLVFFAGIKLQFVQFGQAIHQFGHGGAKLFNQFGFDNAAVFQHVVQQGCHQGLGVELPLGTLGCHGDGVGDVGLTAAAQLTQMRFIGQTVCAPDLLNLVGGEVVQFGHQGSKTGRRRIGRCVGGLGRLGRAEGVHSLDCINLSLDQPQRRSWAKKNTALAVFWDAW